MNLSRDISFESHTGTEQTTHQRGISLQIYSLVFFSV